jgi:hypothetical protein
VTANCKPELFAAVIEGAACGLEGTERKFADADGDLMYNALSIAVLTALHEKFKAYEPDGYVFEVGQVGERTSEGVTVKLRAVESQVNELVAALVPLVKSGAVTLDQVPEASRAAVAAML